VIEMTSVEGDWLFKGRGAKYRPATPEHGNESRCSVAIVVHTLLKEALEIA
jgi:hypothetical protein